MSYATLMVHLELGHKNEALLKIARGLAERLQAGVTGIAVCQPMRVLYNDGYVPTAVIDQDRQQIDGEIRAAEAEFRAAMSDIAEWRSSVTFDPLSDCLAKEACRADLIVTGAGPKASMLDSSRHVDLGDLVMQAGRPCLIVPAAATSLALEHAVVGWKDSTETRRAIADALPLLKLAGRVTVVSIAAEEDLAEAGQRLRDVVAWLKRHGIAATPLVAPSTGDDAVRLDAIVREQGGDLLVAGAYGHSRVREWALGGVTRDLLLRADRFALVSH